MTLSTTERHRIAVSTARRNDIDAGVAMGGGKIKLYSGVRPSSGGDPVGDLLCVVQLTDVCGTVDASGLHITAIGPAQATSAGVVRWARITDSDDVAIIDGDVRVVGDPDILTADIVVDIAQVYPGGFVVLLSATISEG